MCNGGSTTRSLIDALADRGVTLREFEARFLNALIAHEGGDDHRVGDGRCGEDFDRGQKGAELLRPVPVDHSWHAEAGEPHQDQGEGEESDEGDFAFRREEEGSQYDGDREGDEK